MAKYRTESGEEEKEEKEEKVPILNKYFKTRLIYLFVSTFLPQPKGENTLHFWSFYLAPTDHSHLFKFLK